MLTDKQIKEFREALEKAGASFDGYTEDQIREIANGAANYYATLAKINLRLKKEEKERKTN
jgi:hypothetical protein